VLQWQTIDAIAKLIFSIRLYAPPLPGVAKTTGPGYAGQQGLPTTAAGPGAPVGAGGPVTYTGNP
jgi:hypothetical protein